MWIQKSLFLLMLSSFFICCSQSEQSHSCWNSSMDSLLVNYLCANQSNCETSYGHPEDVVYGVDEKKLNCLVDSLAKYKSGLSYTEYYLFESIPDSIFHLSEKAIEKIMNTEDSCLHELGMVALSEKRIITYKFKNICHIKKFEGVKKVSVRELGDYWLFDYQNELGNLEVNLLERKAEKFIAESVNQNNIKKSFEVGSCVGNVVDAYTAPFFGGLEISLNISMENSCLVRQNLWPYYISKSEDTIYFKIAPPTNLLYADNRESRNYNTFNEQSKLDVIPKSGKKIIRVPWVPQRTVHFFKESTFFPFDHVEKGNVLVIDFPCFDDEFTKKYYAFHIEKTKYPYLRCVINPIAYSIAKK